MSDDSHPPLVPGRQLTALERMALAAKVRKILGEVRVWTSDPDRATIVKNRAERRRDARKIR